MYNQPTGTYSSRNRRRYSNAAATNTFGASTTTASGTRYTVKTLGNPASMGDVEISVVGTTFGSEINKVQQNQNQYSRYTPDAGVSYPAGTTLSIRAVPASGFRFVQWRSNVDGLGGTSGKTSSMNPITVKLTKNVWFEACFDKALSTPTRTIAVDCDKNAGKVVANGLVDGQMTAAQGSTVTLEAVPNQGYKFVEWKGYPVSGNARNPVSFSVNNNYAIRAVFASTGTPDPNTDDPHNEEPGGGGGGGNGGGSPFAPPQVPPSAGTVETIVAYAKKYWWALLIAAYLIFKDRKGGK